MKTAFVTGATGFLGTNLVEELVAQGWQVTALRRRASNVGDLQRFPVRLADGDILDPGSLRASIPEGVDAVFHVAASTSMWSRRNAEQTRINVDGTRNVVEAALARGARRLVHTSSIAAYGQLGTRVTEETPPVGEASWINYFRTKRQGERVVEAASDQLDSVILNPANIIGPYDRHNWSRLFLLVLAGKLPGVPPGMGSWCHAREVARAHIAAAERGRRGQHYILSCVDASYLELVRVFGGYRLTAPGAATVAFGTTISTA